MDIAKDLATIYRLCAQEFPAGQGYFLVELETGPVPPDGSRERTADDVQAYLQGIAQRLNDRWAEQLPWGQLTVRERVGRGEEIPEPWATLALRTDVLNVWQAEDTGRWIALGVADRDDQDEIQLLAAVTEMDPP